MNNAWILERLATGEVRIRRGLGAMERLTRLAREGRPLAADESVPPLDDAIAHLAAAIDALVLLKVDVEGEALRAELPIVDGPA